MSSIFYLRKKNLNEDLDCAHMGGGGMKEISLKSKKQKTMGLEVCQCGIKKVILRVTKCSGLCENDLNQYDDLVGRKMWIYLDKLARCDNYIMFFWFVPHYATI